MTTILLPVSRPDYLDRVFHALEVLECDAKDMRLMVLVDGDDALLAQVRPYVDHAKFRYRECHQFAAPAPVPHHDIMARRRRIADIHNQFRRLVPVPSLHDYVFGIEDDTVVPANALERLVEAYARYPHAGMVSGVELGRWGIPHVGAWEADDVYDTTSLQSPALAAGIQEVDASGMYCFLSKASTYTKHEFGLFDSFLGPDIGYGISLRREGYRNFIHWDVSCIHMRREGALTLGNTQPHQVELKREADGWKVYI